MTMSRVKPTAKQAEVLRLYVDTFAERQCYPSIEEAAAQLHVRPNAVYGHLQALSARGWVRLPQGRSRAVEVIGLRVSAELPDAPWTA